MVHQPVFLGQLRHPRLHGPEVVSGQLGEQVVQRLATAGRRRRATRDQQKKTKCCSCCTLCVVLISGLFPSINIVAPTLLPTRTSQRRNKATEKTMEQIKKRRKHFQFEPTV